MMHLDYGYRVQSVWNTLSRTCSPMKAKAKYPARTKSTPSRGFKRFYGTRILNFIYQALGVTAPLGIYYVVGTLTEKFGGQVAIASLFIGVGTSLLTGLMCGELITMNSSISGQLTVAFYQLVGEFPAFFVAVLYLVVAATTNSALAKALAATVDELFQKRIEEFFQTSLGTLPLSNLPPDFASGVVVVVSTLFLVFGLKHSGILKLAMNVLSLVGYLIFLVFGGLHVTSEGHSSAFHHKTPGFQQALVGGGIACILFTQYFELSRQSKKQRMPNSSLSLSVCLVCAIIFVISLPLSILLSLLINDSSVIITGAPLIHAFTSNGLAKTSLLLTAIQISILGFAIGCSGEDLAGQMVVMAELGFMPSCLVAESPSSFSHYRAHIFGGFLAFCSAICLSHLFILKLMAANLVLINTIVCLSVLYRPYRCHVGSICKIPARIFKSKGRPTPSSSLKASSKLAEDSSKHQNKMKQTVYSLKKGLRFSHLGPDLTNLPKVIPHSKKLSLSNPSRPLEPNNLESELPESESESEEEPLENFRDEKENCSSSSESDIDAIVSEFKKNIKVSTRKTILIGPTPTSARWSFICIVSLCLVMAMLIGVLRSLFSGWMSFTQSGVYYIIICLMMCLILLILLKRFPRNLEKLRIPGAPWVPALTLFFNLTLLLEAFYQTMWALIPAYLIAGMWYAIYVTKHSRAAEESEKQRKQQEQLNLSPLVPSTVYTMQQTLGSLPYLTEEVSSVQGSTGKPTATTNVLEEEIHQYSTNSLNI